MKERTFHPRSRKSLWIAATALLIITVAFFLVWRFYGPNTADGAKTITISVTGPEGGSESYTVHTDAEYLLEAAESVLTLEGEDSEYGYTLYTINGITADWDNQVYWAIYVNDTYGNYSIDQQPVTDGDAYAFVYEPF